MITCDTVGCDNEAEFLDGLHNNICEDCMEMEISDSDCEAEDFMAIASLTEKPEGV